jgi:hypothetical protein
MMVLLALWRAFTPAPLTLAGRTFTTRAGKFGAAALSALGHGVVAAGIIWACYGFHYAGLQSRAARPGSLHSALGNHRRLDRLSRQSAARPRHRARTPRSLPLRLRLRDRHRGDPLRVSQRRLQRDRLGEFLPVGLRSENHASGARRHRRRRRTRCPPLAHPHRARARGALPRGTARGAVCGLLAFFTHEPSQHRAPPHPADLPRVCLSPPARSWRGVRRAEASCSR